ncbi:MAG: DUF4129 domain-containing protein [Anaerolineales bacterium]
MVEREIKTRVLLAAAGALALIVVLAAGLSRVDFTADSSYTLEQLLVWMWQRLWGAFTRPDPLTLNAGFVLQILQFFIAAGILLLPIFIVYLVISPEFRKQVLRDILRLALFVAAFEVLRHSPLFQEMDEIFGEIAERPALEISSLPETPALSTPTSSSVLVTVVTVVVALLVAAAVLTVAWRAWQRRRQEPPLERLAQEAATAVAELRAGADVRDTVTRCYVRMMEEVERAKGLRRERTLTAREFEAYLESRGLPAGPVRDLTRLFEQVRYGFTSPGEEQAQRAIDSLTAIVEACRGTV